jgi:hypothetical protein
MRPGLIVGGVLGLGTAIVFGLAAVTATLFPSGATVATQINGWVLDGTRVGPGWARGGAVPVLPPQIGPAVNVQAGGVIAVPGVPVNP